ncbi:MAG: ligase-associated DNA damage response exonuclease [Desulfobacterales bacterium]
MLPPWLQVTADGLFCPPAGVHIDPRRPVARAVVSHAHADHARPGCGGYLATPETARLLRLRLGQAVSVQELSWGEPLVLGGVRLSFHPSGHIRGAAQVRLERAGEVWVVTGDVKTAPDPTCLPYEPVRGHGLVLESTFALPVFRWPDPATVIADLLAWWRDNAEQGRPSLLFAYALGKSQRILASLPPDAGPVLLHGALEAPTAAYREGGVRLRPARRLAAAGAGEDLRGALVLAPPSAAGTPWMRRFAGAGRAFASGWMQIRGLRRRRALEAGFVLSDHADWPGLFEVIRQSGAPRVLLVHGFAAELARALREAGLAAEASPADPPREEDEAPP